MGPMNPVTLKELRQLTRSRTISGAIIGFFLLQLVAAALVVVAQTDSAGELDSDAGELVFSWLAALLAPVLAFVVPGNLFARLVSEHGPGRSEPLSATALRPSQLVDGKIRSGLALAAAFLSGSLPFLLCSYLLGGVDVLFVLSWSFAIALCASLAVHLSLFLAALRVPAAVRWCAWAFAAIPCVPFALLSAQGYKWECDWDEWPFLLFGSAIIVTANLLLRGAAIALVSPPATDRVRPLRLTALGLWLAWLAVMVGFGIHGRTPSEAVIAFSAFAGTGVLALAAFDLSSASGFSRRVLIDRPRSRLRRLLRFPFSTGAEGGLAFALGLLAAGGAGAAFVCVFGHPDPDPRNLGVGCQIALAYILAALLLARAVARIPALARRGLHRFSALAAVVFVLLAMLLPNVLAVGGGIDPDLAPFNLSGITPPGSYWRHGSRVFTRGNLLHHARWAISCLAIALALHARPFLRAFRAYVLSPEREP
jgi:hypothetical protein